jgi:nucleoside-diphosphate-sugar epimerase
MALMKVLLTGSTGFVGTHMLDSLRKNYEVTCLVRNDDKQQMKTEGNLVFGDITDKDSIRRAMEGIDLVIHLAGVYSNSTDLCWNVNFQGTKNVLEVMLKKGVENILHFSTVMVTGLPNKLPSDETYQYAPRNAYERSKVEAEKLVLKFYSENKIKPKILRPALLYGDGDTNSILFRIVSMLNNNARLIGSGRNTLHFIHIRNLMEAVKHVLKNQECIGKPIIVADELPLSIKQVVSSVCEALKKNTQNNVWTKIVSELLSSFNISVITKNNVPTKSNSIIIRKNMNYSIENARKLIGYKPEINTEKGIKKTVEWYLNKGLLQKSNNAKVN